MAVKGDDEYVVIKRRDYDDLRRSEAFLRHAVAKYFEALEKADIYLKSDKSRGSYEGAHASLKYLMALRSPTHLRRPLIEAVEFLKKGLTIKPDELSKDALVQIFSAVALDLLMERKPQPTLNDAAREVVGHDSKDIRTLIDARKKIKTQNLPRGSNEAFWAAKKKLLQDYPNRDDAIARALKGVRVMRGGKP
jgi:hypothetical protein